jgi:ABC-type multidrug transport system ATPase subunit
LSVLSVRGVSKRYGRVAALDGASFDVRAGEVLGLIGPNGAGKTTLFECLAGVRPPDAGEVVTTAGRPLGPSDRQTILFYMPDGIRPYPDRRVSWVLQYFCGFFGGAAARASELASAFALTPFASQRMGTLSKGQLKRTLLALAVLTPQPVLLIDEPFDGLDLRQMRDAAAVLRRQAAAGRTLFLSIHQIADAAKVCDRLVLLSGGRVFGEGTPADLMTRSGAADMEGAFLALT